MGCKVTGQKGGEVEVEGEEHVVAISKSVLRPSSLVENVQECWIAFKL